MKTSITSGEWRSELAALNGRLEAQNALVADCDAITSRHALARLRGEPGAVAACADAEKATLAAAAECTLLKSAIAQGNQKLDEATAAEREALDNAERADHARRAEELIDLDLRLIAAAAEIAALLTERKGIVHWLLRHPRQDRGKASLHALTDLEALLGAALSVEPEFGRSLRLYGDARAGYKFVARDCHIFGVGMPAGLDNPPMSAADKATVRPDKLESGGAAPGPSKARAA